MRTPPLFPRPALAPLLPILLAAAAAAPAPLAAQTAASENGRIVADTIPAPSLAGNLLGDPTRQPAFVYLPPGYDADPERRYATIYLLHGVFDAPRVWVEGGYQGMRIGAVMDSLIAGGEIRPTIVVMPNGSNAYGGSFYMNSPVAGAWESYVVEDVVRHVDGAYRTLRRPESRALVGHSMGGYGAVRLAMRHPGVFSVAWGMNPCCLCCLSRETPPDHPVWTALDTLDSPAAMWRHYQVEDDAWPLLVAAAGAVLAPAPDDPPLYFEPPYRIEGDSVVATGSRRAMAAKLPMASVADRADALRSLRGLAMDVAFDDPFAHIPPSTVAFSDTLLALEVPHLLEAYEGEHGDRMSERLPGRVLPWVDARLAH